MRGVTRQLHGDEGVSCVELLLGLLLIALLTSLAVPVTAHSIDAARARHAAGFIAARFRLARQDAVFRTRSTGVVFDLAATGWTFRVCADGNGNGIRRTDIAGGEDACHEGPYHLAQMFPGVEVAIDAALPGPDGDPGTSDPVRFGASNIASFSPEGTGTAGTLFLRSARGGQYAIRLNNITGRTRILRYDPGSLAWVMR